MSVPTDDRPTSLDSKAALDAFVAANDRVLVMFRTAGCGMCDAMEPVLGNVARASDVAVAVVNPRDDPALIEAYDVRSVPKLLSFDGGELTGSLEDGFVPTEDVLAFLDGP